MSTISERLHELRNSIEEKEHSPYKRKGKIGPTDTPKFGPPPSDTVVHKKKNYWDCHKVGKYVQLCKGKNGEKKMVFINQGYKQSYNQAYRAWKASKQAKKTAKKK